MKTSAALPLALALTAQAWPFSFLYSRSIEVESRQTGGQQLSPEALNLISQVEGFRGSFYSINGDKTIGFGHDCTQQKDCAGIKAPLSREQGMALLQKDAQKFSSCVNKLPNSDKLNANQFGALTSFAFNSGCGGLNKHFKSIMQKGDPNAVCSSIGTTNTLGGQLSSRRGKEAQFCGGKSPSSSASSKAPKATSSKKSGKKQGGKGGGGGGKSPKSKGGAQSTNAANSAPASAAAATSAGGAAATSNGGAAGATSAGGAATQAAATDGAQPTAAASDAAQATDGAQPTDGAAQPTDGAAQPTGADGAQPTGDPAASADPAAASEAPDPVSEDPTQATDDPTAASDGADPAASDGTTDGQDGQQGDQPSDPQPAETPSAKIRRRMRNGPHNPYVPRWT